MRATLTVQVLATSWLVAAVLSAIVGLLQFFGYTHGLGVWVNTTEIGSAYANLRQRNHYATLTSIGLAVVLWSVGRHALERNHGPLYGTSKSALVVACLLLLALGNAASGSRTGMLQWLAILLLSFIWRRPGDWRLPGVAIAAFMAYLAAVFLLPGMLVSLKGIYSEGLLGRFHEAAGCAGRRVLWANVLHLIAQKPWTGWGWGELKYAHFVTLYPGERFCDILDNAHNLPLHLAVEMGLPFAILVCCVASWLVIRLKPMAEPVLDRRLAWSVLVVIALHSLLEYPLWYGPFQIAVIASLALLCRCNHSAITIKTAAIAMVAMVGIFLAAFDYWRASQLYLIESERSSWYREGVLNKVGGSWLFEDQVNFAVLTTTALTLDNAAKLHDMAVKLLHFSPEPRVVEKLIESAVLLGRNDEAMYYLARYRAAFPEAHAQWAADSSPHKTP